MHGGLRSYRVCAKRGAEGGVYLQLLSLLAILAFSLAGWTVAIRLFSLWRRTRAVPEAAMAGMMLGVAGLGYPLILIGNATASQAPKLAPMVMAAAIASINAGISCTFVFTWKVFRPDSRWARRATYVSIFLLGMITVAVCVSAFTEGVQTEIKPEAMFFSMLDFALSGAAFLWSGSESFRYHFLLKRRLAIGLADPVLANRFLLWGLQGLSTTFINLANIYAIARGVNFSIDPTTLLITGVCGILNAGLLTLAFLPPEAWKRFIRNQSEKQENYNG